MSEIAKVCQYKVAASKRWYSDCQGETGPAWEGIGEKDGTIQPIGKVTHKRKGG